MGCEDTLAKMSRDNFGRMVDRGEADCLVPPEQEPRIAGYRRQLVLRGSRAKWSQYPRDLSVWQQEFRISFSIHPNSSNSEPSNPKLSRFYRREDRFFSRG